ncbi:ribosomal protein L5 domain-containing protein [Boletus edulis]|uniref:Ribosomal protein L5 domain-containing protein n=1 Tax=Boletus edulis BED1 TaxID=1328754 RepID=A0AAD4BV28_BOLED|nr:ribosomal protein L5 domain-containing protein [Boletus edulis]KAF8440788.1 ribosomal protein L5 domain-containing protein [Boletus edulis BED1]
MSVTRIFRKPPRIRRALRVDDRGLPIPHVDITIHDTAPCRFREHYYSTLQDNLMYMSYVHESGPRPPPREVRLRFDPNDPYSKNRLNTPVGGDRLGKKPAPPTTPENVVKLERIVLHTMLKEAMTNRSVLLNAIASFRAISGETNHGGGRHSSAGVQIVKGKKSVSGWVRPGVPLGVKVELKGPQMYNFITTLSEFVLPRLREFPGIVLPPSSSNMQTPSGVAGVVSFGLPPEALGLFPQIEVNLEAYPKIHGMHIHFITNAEGQGAQNKARALVSGFQIPFSRK